MEQRLCARNESNEPQQPLINNGRQLSGGISECSAIESLETQVIFDQYRYS